MVAKVVIMRSVEVLFLPSLRKLHGVFEDSNNFLWLWFGFEIFSMTYDDFYDEIIVDHVKIHAHTI